MSRPTPDRVDEDIARMNKLHGNYQYFFERLQSTDWIEPLAEREFFKHPYPPKIHDDGSLSFPIWPESQYLARMAKRAPALVGATLLAMPYTDNVFIHGDIVEASLAMPGQDAAKLSASERKWVASQRQLFWLLPDRYSKLVVHLVQNGEVDEAFGLARVIMEVSPDPRWADAKPEDRLFMSKEPVTRMAQWDYQQVAQTIGAALQHADARRSLLLFADILERAMSLAEPIEDDDPADNSYIWRPAVEHHSQNRPEHSPRDVLVVATRDAAIQAAGTDRASIELVVQQLESRRRSVFQRIAFHFLADIGSNS